MNPECTHLDTVRDVEPRTPQGCEECLAIGAGWVHLRLCLQCGHVGCCDASPNKHATKHFHSQRNQNPVMRASGLAVGDGVSSTRVFMGASAAHCERERSDPTRFVCAIGATATSCARRQVQKPVARQRAARLARRAALDAGAPRADARANAAARGVRDGDVCRRIPSGEQRRVHRDMDRPLDRSAPDGRPERPDGPGVQRARISGAVDGPDMRIKKPALPLEALPPIDRAPVAQPLRPPRQTGREAPRRRAPGRHVGVPWTRQYVRGWGVRKSRARLVALSSGYGRRANPLSQSWARGALKREITSPIPCNTSPTAGRGSSRRHVSRCRAAAGRTARAIPGAWSVRAGEARHAPL